MGVFASLASLRRVPFWEFVCCHLPNSAIYPPEFYPIRPSESYLQHSAHMCGRDLNSPAQAVIFILTGVNFTTLDSGGNPVMNIASNGIHS